jgi:DNA invertase Pin-like site-specific DNA recombinase
MAVLAYERVSTTSQVTDGQRDRLGAYGYDRIFSDVGESGRKSSRPAFDEMLAYARPGDKIVVVKLDRLGRNARDLLNLSHSLSERGIDLVILDLGVDTSTPAGSFFFTIMSAVAQMEADLNHERTVDGIAAARARGRKGGRTNKLDPYKARSLVAEYQAKKSIRELCEEYGVSKFTLYEYVKRAEKDMAR